MIEHLKDIWIFAAIVYAIVEGLKKFGLNKKYAHILALPISIGLSVWGFPVDGVMNKVIYGVIIGILSVGSCDTACNVVNVFKENSKKP
jgi:hypothetical protein